MQLYLHFAQCKHSALRSEAVGSESTVGLDCMYLAYILLQNHSVSANTDPSAAEELYELHDEDTSDVHVSGCHDIPCRFACAIPMLPKIIDAFNIPVRT